MFNDLGAVHLLPRYLTMYFSMISVPIYAFYSVYQASVNVKIDFEQAQVNLQNSQGGSVLPNLRQQIHIFKNRLLIQLHLREIIHNCTLKDQHNPLALSLPNWQIKLVKNDKRPVQS